MWGVYVCVGNILPLLMHTLYYEVCMWEVSIRLYLVIMFIGGGGTYFNFSPLSTCSGILARLFSPCSSLI